MKPKNSLRIALRLPSEQREKIDQLIRSGKAKNLSEVVRAALSKYIGAMEDD